MSGTGARRPRRPELRVQLDEQIAPGGEDGAMRAELAELRETLDAVRSGQVDSLVVGPPGDERVLSLSTADRPYRLVFEEMNEGAAIIDGQGLILAANRGLDRMTAHEAGALVGSPVANVVSPKHRDAFNRALGECKASGERQELELSLVGGWAVPALVSMSTFEIDDRAVSCVVVTDLSQWRRDEDVKREERHMAQSLIESSLDSMMTISSSRLIAEANRASESLFGKPRAELIGAAFGDLFTDPTRARDGIRRVVEIGSIHEYELTVLRPDGGTTEVSYNAVKVFEVDGEPFTIFATGRDITAHKRLELLQREALERMRALDQAKTDFVSRVSHELRSPLTSVLGYLELLEDDAGAVEESHRWMLKAIDGSGRRLLALVEDLLTLARVDAGELKLDIRHMALGPLIQASLQAFRPAIAERRIQLTERVEPGIELDADPQQVERVITNLVSNAVKYTAPDGRIDVTACLQEACAVISVRDTGVGIPIDEQPRLFTRFFRSSLSDKTEAQGTGLGLYIVKQVIDAHGGAIEVTSAAGKGTTITVRLPLTQATDTEPPTAHRPEEREGTNDG